MTFCDWEANYHKPWTQVENNCVAAKDFGFCRCSNSAIIPLAGEKNYLVNLPWNICGLIILFLWPPGVLSQFGIYFPLRKMKLLAV